MSDHALCVASLTRRASAAVVLGALLLSVAPSVRAAPDRPLVDYSLTLDGGAWIGASDGGAFVVPGLDTTLRISWHVTHGVRIGFEAAIKRGDRIAVKGADQRQGGVEVLQRFVRARGDGATVNVVKHGTYPFGVVLLRSLCGDRRAGIVVTQAR